MARRRIAPAVSRGGMDWLLRTTSQMVRCRNVSALLDLAYDAIGDGLGYDRVGLSLVDRERRALIEHIGTDEQGRKFYPRDRVKPLDGKGHYARVLADPRMGAEGPGFIYLADATREVPRGVRGYLDGRPGQLLRVALRSGDAVLGLISVDNLTSGRPITAADAPPIVAFANALAVAVENVTLLGERARRIDDLDADLRQRVEQLTWLQEAGMELALPHDLDRVLDAIYGCLRDGVRYDRVGIMLIERRGDGRLVAYEVRGTDEQGRATHGLPEAFPLDDAELPVHSPDLHHLLQGHAFYYCPDRWAVTPPAYRYQLEGRMREQLAMALRHDGDLVGYISVDNLLSRRPIVETDAAPLVAFAAQAALAISRARLWAAHEAQGQGLARRVVELEWLRDISRRVNAARTLDEVLDVVYDGIRAGLGYDRVGIQLFDHALGVWDERRGTDEQGRKICPEDRIISLTPDSPLWRLPDVAALLGGAESYYTADIYAETPPELRHLLDGTPTQNLVVPLRSGTTVTGMISVDNLLSGRPISSDDAGPLLALANLVGTAVENARLYTDAAARAERDGLTGLCNHRVLLHHLDTALHAAPAVPCALLLLDVDNFKLFNDTYGHPVGDAVLSQVAAILRAACRDGDVAGRYGGDEFALLLRGASAVEASAVAQRLRSAVRAHPHVAPDHTIIPLSISVGMACAPADGRTRRELVAVADKAMYAAKWGGRTEVRPRHAADLLGDSPFGVLEGLVHAVDAKDRYTREHSDDVTRLALLLAEALGLDARERRALAIAGPLHDAGKIAVPDRILRKPGKLTAAEYEAIKRHVTYGVAIIHGVLEDAAVVDAVAHHHERWDGRGYPSGVPGVQTPLVGRIMQVADAVSAMMLDRPYRQGLPWARVVEELQRGAGSQFDPELVEAFIAGCMHLRAAS